jgi:hypothetical protein
MPMDEPGSKGHRFLDQKEVSIETLFSRCTAVRRREHTGDTFPELCRLNLFFPRPTSVSAALEHIYTSLG